MATPSNGMKQAFKDANRTAFILGYTGEVGKELVKVLIHSQAFAKITLIGRRTVEYHDDLYKDVEQKVVDFDKLDDYSDVFKNIDIAYCCLGTTRSKAGADGFYRVDHDYIVNSAKMAKQGGCKQFHLVSSKGADKSSSVLYTKTKGEVEEELKAMQFDSLFIYRPGMLQCKREESRPVEAAANVLLKPVFWAFPTFLSVATSTVAHAMLNRTITPPTTSVETLENKLIHQLGACSEGGK